MKRSILQYLINLISKNMLDTANPVTLAARERCFKDLDINDVAIQFKISPRSGLWTARLSSVTRQFNWPDPFAFKTQDLVTLLKNDAGKVNKPADVLSKTDFDGLFYVKQTNELMLVVPTNFVLEGDLDLNFCTIPASMIVSSDNGIIEVSHPFVVGKITLKYR